MSNFNKILSIILISSFTFCWANNEEDLTIKNYIKSLIEETLSIFDNTSLSKESKALLSSELIRKNLDVDSMTNFVLGREKRKITEEEYKEFCNLYENFIVLYYTNIAKKYTGQRMIIKGITKLRDRDYIVRSLLQTPEEDKGIAINYLIRPQNNSKSKYMVFDVITERVSLLMTQQSEFGSIIKQKGIKFLLSSLEQQIQKLK